MGFLRGDPALNYLSRAKWSGVLRRQRQRLNTVSGALFALLGGAMLLVWLSSVLITIMARRGGSVSPELAEPVTRAALLLLTLLSITGNLTQRGLYLPPGELERFFAAPLARGDIVRYRLNALLLRSSVGSLVLAAMAYSRLPAGWPAALAAFLAVHFIAVLGQGVALVLGAVEQRLDARFLRTLSRFLFLSLLGLTLGTLFVALTLDQLPDFKGLPALLSHPWIQRTTLPFTPWAKLANAESAGEILRWGSICVLLLVGAYEAVARLPFDFREWVLESSQALAHKLRRLRSAGTGASAAQISKRGAGRRVPWLFGRGPLGAIAWRKSAGMWRRARSTLTFSALILAVLVACSHALVGRHVASESIGLALLPTALLGTLYLCSGLRFDFREDIDRLDTIKSWPLDPKGLFLSMLLPEWMVASLLLALALLLQLALGRSDGDPIQWIQVVSVLIPLPLVVGLWLAIDNALFLLWPVRLVPGQDGPLQNVGRAAVLFLLRGLVFGACAGLAALLVWVLWSLAGTPTGAAGRWLTGALGVSLVLSACLLLAVWLGGQVLGRFDPSRDRP